MLLAAALALGSCARRPAVTDPRETGSGGAGAVTRLQAALDAAERDAMADLGSFEAAWRAAKACAELLDGSWDALDRDGRVGLAQRGINHAERAKAIAPDRPDGYYFAAACHGLLGKARGLGGKKAIDPIIENAGKVVEIDPAFEGAGAHRILGALYLKAPAWPASVGDLDRSRAELETACTLAPQVPENHLLLARVLRELGEAEASARELARFEELTSGEEATWPRFWQEELEALRR